MSNDDISDFRRFNGFVTSASASVRSPELLRPSFKIFCRHKYNNFIFKIQIFLQLFLFCLTLTSVRLPIQLAVLVLAAALLTVPTRLTNLRLHNALLIQTSAFLTRFTYFTFHNTSSIFNSYYQDS